MGKRYDYTDQYIRLRIDALGASSQAFRGVMAEESFRRHSEEHRGDLHWQIALSKREEKRKVCETPRKLLGEAGVMSCCLW